MGRPARDHEAGPAPGPPVADEDQDVPCCRRRPSPRRAPDEQPVPARDERAPAAGDGQPVRRPRAAEDRAAAGGFYEPDEAAALYEAAGAIGPQWRTLIELGTEVGLRPGEMSGLHGHRVDWLRGRMPSST